jgi:hypothetical protein
LVTYILLSALHSGLSARWNPNIFGASASRALGVVLLDFLFVKMGCYILGVQQGAVGGSADLVAYGGYKFVGWVIFSLRLRIRRLIYVDSVILTLFAGMLNFGSTIYGLVFLYAFFANAFFLVSLFFGFRYQPNTNRHLQASLSSVSSTPRCAQLTCERRYRKSFTTKEAYYILIFGSCQSDHLHGRAN